MSSPAKQLPLFSEAPANTVDAPQKSPLRLEAERRVDELQKRQPKRLYKDGFYWVIADHREQLINKLIIGMATSIWWQYLDETLPKIQAAAAIRAEERWQECIATAGDNLPGKPRHNPTFVYEEQPVKTTYPRDPEVWQRAMPEKARQW